MICIYDIHMYIHVYMYVYMCLYTCIYIYVFIVHWPLFKHWVLFDSVIVCLRLHGSLLYTRWPSADRYESSYINR